MNIIKPLIPTDSASSGFLVASFPLADPVQPKLQTDPVIARCGGIRAKSHYSFPPLGLGYIAAQLQFRKFTVELFDGNFQNQTEFAAKLFSQKFKAVFLLCALCQLNQAAQFLRQFSAEQRNIIPPVFLIGTAAGALPEYLLSISGKVFTGVIFGEPELTCGEIAERLSKQIPLTDCLGLALIQPDSYKLIINSSRELINDLNQLKFPARQLINLNNYRTPVSMNRRHTTLLASRGCNGGCSYCGTAQIYGGTRRQRTVESVIEEILILTRNYNYFDLGFMDDCFTADRSWVINFCQALKQQEFKYPLRWLCLTRPDLTDSALLKEMKSAGCYQIQFGVETLSPRLLKLINRRIKSSCVYQSFDNCRQLGIETAAFFLTELPTQTVSELYQDFDCALKLNPDYAIFNPVIPWPGSKLYKKYNLTLDQVLNSDTLKPSKFDKSFHQIDNLEKHLRYFYKKFYLRPSYINNAIIRMIKRRNLSSIPAAVKLLKF